MADLTRQVLAKSANQLYYEIISAYQSGNLEELGAKSKTLLELVSDLEQLLASDEGFLLGGWLESAKALAKDQQQIVKVLILLYLSFMKCFILRKLRCITIAVAKGKDISGIW